MNRYALAAYATPALPLFAMVRHGALTFTAGLVIKGRAPILTFKTKAEAKRWAVGVCVEHGFELTVVDLKAGKR